MKHVTTEKIHQYSASVIENSRGSASRVPRYVTGDGNCLFNSVSVVICGNESMTCELRVRTCIELVLNFEYYKNHHQFRDFIRVSPDLEEACRMCAIDLEYSSVFVMQALSSVIGREIVSVYPAMNGLLDNCLSILNTVIVPRISSSTRNDGRIYLLWTKMAGPIPHPRNKTWTPDHFAPLIKKPILKAVRQSFPSACQLLCQRHLEQNIRRYLQHKVGVADKLKNKIIFSIFGKDGLINSKDLLEFELKSMEMSNTFLEIAPNFVSYFDNSLVPRVRDHIFKPRISRNYIPLNWTNNNCESINNILKLSTNWKVLKLPDLIEKLYSIVKIWDVQIWDVHFMDMGTMS